MRIIVGLFLGLLSFVCHAELKPPALNSIKLQLSEEAWVKTDMAKVVVALDASLDQSQLANIHQQILQNLAKIADKVDWHITQFNRSKDQSNLERLQVLAEARLDESHLAKIGRQVEAVSKPGATYRIVSIEYNPSLADIERSRSMLRDKLYEQINLELARLNKVYPNTHYFVHEINFRENIAPPFAKNQLMVIGAQAASSNFDQAMQVSNQLQLTAEVILAEKISGIQERVADLPNQNSSAKTSNVRRENA